MNAYQHQQILRALRAIAIATLGVGLTVLSFVVGQIAVFLGGTTDDARLTTFFAAAFGAAFIIAAMVATFAPVRRKYYIDHQAEPQHNFSLNESA